MFGIYILANDAVLAWLEPFLVSLRTYNPDTPVSVIPYDEPSGAALELAAKYGARKAEIDLAPYDEIGAAFHPDERIAARIYRKLAIFDGPYSSFLYIDIDTIVAFDIAQIERVFSSSSCDICFYRSAMPGRNFVGPIGNELSNGAYPANGFNAAFILGRRGKLSLSQFSAASNLRPLLQNQLGPAREQALLNYCVAVNGLGVTTLPNLDSRLSFSWDSFLDIRFDGAAGVYRTGQNCPDYAKINELIYGPGGPVAGKIVPMIHWGGCGRPSRQMDNFLIWNRFARWPDDVQTPAS